MGSNGKEDIIHHTVATSQHGCVEVWMKSQGILGIVLDGENLCGMLHGRLIITPDETRKDEVLSI